MNRPLRPFSFWQKCKRTLVPVPVLLFILFSFHYSSFAQVKPSVDTMSAGLDEVTVSVNKWEQKQNEIPNTIARINMKDARMYNPQTSADLLAMTGQVFVQKSQLGGGSPMIRGFATNRVLLVVDGVRMNNAIFRSGNLQNVISIDALALQNAEVVFGPGSILYGSDAIGGVMDFHTLHPVFSNSKKPLFKASSFTRYSSASNEATAHLHVNVATRKLSFLASVTRSKFGDLRMGKRGGDDSYLRTFYAERINGRDSMIMNNDPYVQKQTGYKQWNVMGKLRYKPLATLDMQYAFHYSATGNVPRYDRLVEKSGSQPSFAEWYYGPQVWTMHQLKTTHTASNRLYDEAKLNFSLQSYKESRHDRRFGNNRKRNQFEQVDIYTANIDATKELAEKHELYYGAEYVFNKVHSIANRKNIVSAATEVAPPRYPDGATWQSAGVYGSYKYNINRRFTFSTGFRYSIVDLSAQFDSAFFKFPYNKATLTTGALTGSVGLVYRPVGAWQVNANLSTGFRAPNVDDVGKVFDSEAGNVMVPNPTLEAEYAWNLDVGTAYHHDKWRFDVTTFYTLLYNAIVRRPFRFNGQDSILYEGILSRVQALQNTAHAKVWGLQAGVEYKISPRFTTIVRANYIDGRETDDELDKEVRLRHAPPFYGNASVRYTSGGFVAEVYALFNGAVNANNLAPSEQNKPFIYAADHLGRPYSPGWYTLNAKVMYTLDNGLQTSVGVENITNQRYRPYSSGIVAPGLNMIISVRASF